MNLEQFITTISEEIREMLDNTFTVSSHVVMKNNDVKLNALTIKGNTINTAPTVYLDGYWNEYQQGVSIKEIVDRIICVYTEHSNAYFDISDFTDFSKIKDKIIFQLVNTTKNKCFLENVPNMQFLDFSIIFKAVFNSSNHQLATAKIEYFHLNMWNISLDELYSIALKNTPILLPPTIKSMTEILLEIMPDICPLEETPDICPMYVLSNFMNVNGSGCILYPNILNDFAKERQSSFYILPSSIHETILVSADYNISPNELRNMVQEVNCTEVSKEEFLSDNVYYFNIETTEISLV